MATLTERVNKLEIELSKTSEKLEVTLKHLLEEIKDNSLSLAKLEESDKKQSLMIQEIGHTRESDKKLIAVLMTFIGGIVGYIVKMMLD